MSDSGLFTYKITSNGSDIDNTYQVMSMNVERHLNKIATAQITIKDGEAANQKFEVADSETFAPGAEIEIKFGYDSTNESIFKGIVTKLKISTAGEGTVLVITCKDKWVKSTIGSKLTSFEAMTSSAIIEKIAGNYSLTADVTSTSFEHPELVQYKSIDWDLILNLTEKEGMVAFTDAGKLTVAKPTVSGDGSPEVQFGADVWDFSTEVDSGNQVGSLSGTVWDIENQKIVQVTAAEPSVNAQGNLTGSTLAEVMGSVEEKLVSSVAMAQDGIQKWADSALLKNRLSGYSGTLTIEGNSDVKPNSLIKLKGFGDRFNGNAYVSGLTHRAESGRWSTEIHLGLSNKWSAQRADTRPPEMVSSIPAMQSIQTAIVKKIVEDPDNNFRVQIQLPFLSEDDQLVWARMSTFYAGNTFGAQFMPELESEVIVAFINNDPSSAVILGNLFSSKIAAPLTPSEDSNIKTLKTSSGLEMSFDDSDGKVIMTFKTPNGNSIVMSEEDKAITITDQNSNEIKMAEDKVSITSASKLEIIASDDLTIKGSKVTITGSDSVSISGGKIEASSDGNLDVSASGTGSISAGGTMAVKGSMLNLN